jgi:hypothetical protein
VLVAEEAVGFVVLRLEEQAFEAEHLVIHLEELQAVQEEAHLKVLAQVQAHLEAA